MEKIILVGGGGHAISVADSIEEQGIYCVVGYTDNEEKDSPYEYLGTDDVLVDLFRQGIRNAVISVGYLGKGTIRNHLYDQLKRIGFCLPIIADPSAVISRSAKIEEGSFIGKGGIVGAAVQIGKMAIINTNANLGHHCKLGDFSHVAPGGVLCGGAKVGNEVLIGANATVLQNVQIGNHCIIGAGSVVKKDVSDNHLIVENLVKEI